MGKIKQGILGGFNGTVGTVVGGSWKGMAYMRGKAQSIKNPRTEKQMSQRIKFGMAQKFVKVMTAYLKVSFRNYIQHQTATRAMLIIRQKLGRRGESLDLIAAQRELHHEPQEHGSEDGEGEAPMGAAGIRPDRPQHG